MKKLIAIAVLMMTALCAQAQFLSGVELGGSFACSHQFREKGFVNVGADLRATKRVCEWSRLRAVASVNGFVPNGFDRYGTAMVGITADLLPIYAFADFGLSCNPSGKHTIGMAFDIGCGLHFDISERWHLFSELGIDRINSGKLWQSTPAVKAGVMYSVTP